MPHRIVTFLKWLHAKNARAAAAFDSVMQLVSATLLPVGTLDGARAASSWTLLCCTASSIEQHVSVCGATMSFRLLAQIQDRLVDHRVGPVVSQIIQVIVKVNQVVVGPALQQGRRDLLCFAPVLKRVTEAQTVTSVENQTDMKHQRKIKIKLLWLQHATSFGEDELLTMLLLYFSICFHDDRRCAQWVRSNSLLICCCPPKQWKSKQKLLRRKKQQQIFKYKKIDVINLLDQNQNM